MSKEKEMISLYSSDYKDAPCWRWGGAVDYDYTRSNCFCDDQYCRCTTITSYKITNVDMNLIYEYLIDNLPAIFKKNLIVKYCIHRLLSINEIYSPSNWDSNITCGYYGEEVGDRIFSNIEKLEKDLNHLTYLTDTERIWYVLEQEYGYILPTLEKVLFKISYVNHDELIVGNDTYLKKVKKELWSCPEELPIGVYISEGSKYKLVDGYHRFLKNERKTNIPVIVATPWDDNKPWQISWLDINEKQK